MEQPVLSATLSRQQYIALPVNPVLCEQVDDKGQIWRISTLCKRMGTHLPEDCFEAVKKKSKKEEWIKRRKAQDLGKENDPQEEATGKGRNRMNRGHGR